MSLIGTSNVDRFLHEEAARQRARADHAYQQEMTKLMQEKLPEDRTETWRITPAEQRAYALVHGGRSMTNRPDEVDEAVQAILRLADEIRTERMEPS